MKLNPTHIYSSIICQEGRKYNSKYWTFEYPGYGLCKDEEITEGEFYRRIKRIYYFVTKTLKFSPNQIILYGFSLGTGITLDFACKKNYPVAGLILQSPFLSIVRTIYNIKKPNISIYLIIVTKQNIYVLKHCLFMVSMIQ